MSEHHSLILLGGDGGGGGGGTPALWQFRFHHMTLLTNALNPVVELSVCGVSAGNFHQIFEVSSQPRKHYASQEELCQPAQAGP